MRHNTLIVAGIVALFATNANADTINFPIAFWLCLIFEISTPAFL
jgi:hypothetical protein